MRAKVLVLVFLLCLVSLSGIAYAHGVTISLEHDSATGEIEVEAAYDSGDPMTEAQVTIFAPDDLVNPWKQGTADANGVYTFVPDYSKVGTWEVQVRLAGHGNTNYIYLDESMAPSDAAAASDAESAVPMAVPADGSLVIQGDATIIVQGEVGTGKTVTTTGFSGEQIILMAACVVWGFVGTALFFARRRSESKHKAGQGD